MRRRDVLLGGLAAAACRTPSTDDPPAPPPVDPFEPVANGRAPLNVVLVLTDDQRWDSFGFMGHPFLTTPNLDRLATRGAWFRQSFVTTSLCCPSRATMLTGRYAHDHGVVNNTSELGEAWPTFATLAQRAGVNTAYIGKWHMGGHTPAPRPGWTTWQSFRGQGRYDYPGPPKLAALDRGMDVNGAFQELSGYVTDLLTDRAVDFLRNVETRDPFCLVVGHKACHAPFQPAPRHRDAFADAQVPEPLPRDDAAYEDLPAWLSRQRDSLFGVDRPYHQWKDFRSWYLDYHRTLLAVDEGMGRILATLEDRGLLERTAVLYLSDNGFMHGEKGSLDKRAAYDTSMRIPWLAHVPGASPGQVRDELVLNLDVAATVLDLLGIAPGPTMRGVSVLPLLLGDATPPWRDAFLYEYFFERSFPTIPAAFAVRTATHKLVTYHGVPERSELFDLAADPMESKNVLDEQPQRRKALTRRLHQLMDAEGLLVDPIWSETQRDARYAPVPNGPRGERSGQQVDQEE